MWPTLAIYLRNLNTILKTRSQVFEWLFLEIFIQPKTWRRIFKSCWCFQISSSSFPTFSPSQNKNSPSRFYFLRRRFFFNVRKLISLIARVLQLIDFQFLPVQWQAKMPCHWCHFCNRVTSVTCEKQAHCTGKCWYSTVYDIRAKSAMGLRK